MRQQYQSGTANIARPPDSTHRTRVLRARRYFEASADAGAPKLFDWEIEKARSGGMAMFGGGDNEPNYKIMEDDTTLAFVRTWCVLSSLSSVLLLPTACGSSLA